VEQVAEGAKEKGEVDAGLGEPGASGKIMLQLSRSRHLPQLRQLLLLLLLLPPCGTHHILLISTLAYLSQNQNRIRNSTYHHFPHLHHHHQFECKH